MLQIFKEKYFLRIFVLCIVLVTLYLYNDHITTNYQRSSDTQMRMAVVGTLGGPAIPIIAQCCTSRNLPEGIYARRSDFPGGFCFHSDCDVVSTTGIFFEKVYTLKVIKKRP